MYGYLRNTNQFQPWNESGILLNWFQMNRETNIRTTIELPCSFILCGTDHKFVLGMTELLTRDSLVALISLATPSEWLNDTASVIIAVDLPCTGLSEPRVLECAATISRVRPSTWGMRVDAKVNRMKFQNRENYLLKHNCTGVRQSGVKSILAIRKSRALQSVTALRHQKLLTKLFNQQGEHNMSFFKEFFRRRRWPGYGRVRSRDCACGAGRRCHPHRLQDQHWHRVYRSRLRRHHQRQINIFFFPGEDTVLFQVFPGQFQVHFYDQTFH